MNGVNSINSYSPNLYNNLDFKNKCQTNISPHIKPLDTVSFSGTIPSKISNDDPNNPTPTVKEIKGCIDHLPTSEKDAEKKAKKDVKNSIKQIKALIKDEGITTPEAYKDYMQIYTILGEKVFQVMTPEQKTKSIMLQVKSLEEMQKQAISRINMTKPKDIIVNNLLNTQIEMSRITLIKSQMSLQNPRSNSI